MPEKSGPAVPTEEDGNLFNRDPCAGPQVCGLKETAGFLLDIPEAKTSVCHVFSYGVGAESLNLCKCHVLSLLCLASSDVLSINDYFEFVNPFI